MCAGFTPSEFVIGREYGADGGGTGKATPERKISALPDRGTAVTQVLVAVSNVDRSAAEVGPIELEVQVCAAHVAPATASVRRMR